MLTKYVKVLIIVCLALLVFMPWIIPRKRTRKTGAGPDSDGGTTLGHGS